MRAYAGPHLTRDQAAALLEYWSGRAELTLHGAAAGSRPRRCLAVAGQVGRSGPASSAWRRGAAHVPYAACRMLRVARPRAMVLSMTRDALATISRIADPVERAARAQELVESLREAIGTAEQVRDAAIREARALPGRLTVDALAQAIGCRRNVIVDATRKRNGGA